MLNYKEKLLLVLYKELYGKHYACNQNCKLADGIVAEHLQAQKATYLFAQYNLLVDDYNFIWDLRGPFSLALQDCLHSLDECKSDVEKFYCQYVADKEKNLKKLFTEKQIERMNKLIDGLRHIITDQDELEMQCETCELLCSFIYLSRTVMPGRPFEAVNLELQRRKSYLNNNDYNQKVWHVLKDTDLLSV